eukprot:maker-scaffold_33-snap-gene-0.1-mRNA-1 protein AED:0.01 eAED:0.01 QI:81/1/1/1/1/1/2/216/514
MLRMRMIAKRSIKIPSHTQLCYSIGKKLSTIKLHGSNNGLAGLSTSLSAERNQRTQDDNRKKIVVVGSGWGAYCFMQKIDKSKFSVHCVSPSNHFLFTPLLPSSAVGTLEFRAIQEPIRGIKGLDGFSHAKGLDVNFNKQTISCRSIFPHETENFELNYDYLVVACGAKTNTFNTPGIAENENNVVFFLKHLYHARQLRNRIVECYERAATKYDSTEHLEDAEDNIRRLLSFIIVGGGPTSVEFAGELRDLVQRDLRKSYPHLEKYVSIKLIEAGPRILPSFHPSLAQIITKNFSTKEKGVKIEVLINTAVRGYSDKSKEITIESNNSAEPEKIKTGLIVWSAGLQQVKFVENNFQDTERGPGNRLLIDSTLNLVQKTGPPLSNVFALGDCAVSANEPLAPLAAVAKQQGNYLAKQLNMKLIDGDTSNFVDFKYKGLFSMVTFGTFKGAIDFSSMGGLNLGGGKLGVSGYLQGLGSFLTWRSAYWGMQTSFANKLLIPMYWFKSFFLGRDISRF